MAVNGVKIKNDKKKEESKYSAEENEKIVAEWKKVKLPVTEDNANKAEIEKIALKYIDDINLASTKVTDQEEVAKFLSAKKVRVCWSCWTINCYKKQIISNQLKFKKRYLNKCTGKPTTFKDLKAKQPKLPAATAQISPPASTAYDSDDDCINNIISEMNFEEPMFGHRQVFVT